MLQEFSLSTFSQSRFSRDELFRGGGAYAPETAGDEKTRSGGDFQEN